MSNEVVVKVLVHCEGCATQLYNILKGFEGVEDIKVDGANDEVIVKGEKLDHMKILERIQKKYSRNVELLHPKPTTKNNEQKKPEKKEEPKVMIVVLKMFMNCEGCAQDIRNDILKMKGVYTVEPNMEKSIVTVKGEMQPSNIVEMIKKRHRKNAVIVKQEQMKQKQDRPKQDKHKHEEIPLHHYYPFGSQNYIFPCDFASDENVNACSIM